MDIRRAVPSDANLLAEHRAAVWHEVGEWTTRDLAPQIPVWTAFFERCIREETYVGAIAERDGEVLGSGSILVYLTIPRPGIDSDRAGRVQSVYVTLVARRQGVARAIMKNLIAYGRERKLVSLMLHPSEQARSLYASLGFTAADEMSLALTNAPAKARS